MNTANFKYYEPIFPWWLPALRKFMTKKNNAWKLRTATLDIEVEYDVGWLFGTVISVDNFVITLGSGWVAFDRHGILFEAWDTVAYRPGLHVSEVFAVYNRGMALNWYNLRDAIQAAVLDDINRHREMDREPHLDDDDYEFIWEKK